MEDRDLAGEYRVLAYLGSPDEAPLYARIHGDAAGRHLVHLEEGDRLRAVMAADERRSEWYDRAVKDWPEYAAARVQQPATLADIGTVLGIG